MAKVSAAYRRQARKMQNLKPPSYLTTKSAQEATEQPFNEGDTVRINTSDHLGLHRVDSCEWFDATTPGVPHYWLCHCTQIREPIDWSKYPDGATGIVTSSTWHGSSKHLALATPSRTPAERRA